MGEIELRSEKARGEKEKMMGDLRMEQQAAEQLTAKYKVSPVRKLEQSVGVLGVLAFF